LAFVVTVEIDIDAPSKKTRALNRKWDSEEEKFEKTIAFSLHYDVIVVMKERQRISSMPKSVQEYYRKCGFGHSRKRDVLTGIITSLLAQSYEPITAAVLGAYLHGLAADIALPETGYQSFIASDNQIFGKAFLSITK
jgi:NAD(P)H-hydrate repair Nnr-like enzyme with NAD(P)H-hydrate dehydratase domain